MLSEQQIVKLKDKLLERKEHLLSEVSFSQDIIYDLLSGETNDELDYAEVSSDSFNMNTLRNKQLEELKEIELALSKIKNNQYGICDMCDEEIGIKRLKAKPHSRFCIHCRPIYEKSLQK